mmetsp:Transcript_22248/g.53274  ORF Transcript_22248/g.53274 Transcript_22248/m.53274 type:complete len:171 (+) Transcript_22248:77-589(+)
MNSGPLHLIILSMNEPSSFEQYSGSLGRFASSQNSHLTQELLQEFLVILHLILHCFFSAFVLSTLHACLHVFRVVSHFSSHSFLAGKSCRHGAIGGIGGGGGRDGIGGIIGGVRCILLEQASDVVEARQVTTLRSAPQHGHLHLVERLLLVELGPLDHVTGGAEAPHALE